MRVPASLGRAESGELRPAHFDNVLHIAERLDVVDDGRTHPTSPAPPGKYGGLMRGTERLPSSDSIRPVSSPQM